MKHLLKALLKAIDHYKINKFSVLVCILMRDTSLKHMILCIICILILWTSPAEGKYTLPMGKHNYSR